MPIVVKAPEGAITPGAEEQLFHDLMTLLLETGGTSLENPIIAPNLIGDLQIMPEGMSFAGGRRGKWVAVQLRVPSFNLTKPAEKVMFIREATEAVLRATGGRIAKDRVFVNMVYGDSFWGIGGAFFNDESLAAVIVEADQLKAAS